MRPKIDLLEVGSRCQSREDSRYRRQGSREPHCKCFLTIVGRLKREYLKRGMKSRRGCFSQNRVVDWHVHWVNRKKPT